MSSEQPKKKTLSRALWSLPLVALGGVAWAVLQPEQLAGYDGPVWQVERRPLTIAVSESGTIESRDKRILKCEVDERSTTITFIIPEGTRVGEGDLLVELDSSVLQDELYDEEIDVVTERLTALLEPIMIVALAAVVGYIVYSIVLPILQVGQL